MIIVTVKRKITLAFLTIMARCAEGSRLACSSCGEFSNDLQHINEQLDRGYINTMSKINPTPAAL